MSPIDRRLEHEREAILKYEFFGHLCSILGLRRDIIQ